MSEDDKDGDKKSVVGVNKKVLGVRKHSPAVHPK